MSSQGDGSEPAEVEEAVARVTAQGGIDRDRPGDRMVGHAADIERQRAVARVAHDDAVVNVGALQDLDVLNIVGPDLMPI